MGLNWGLTGFPLFILLISIVFQTGGAYASNGSSVDFSSAPAGSVPGTNTDCSAFSFSTQLQGAMIAPCLSGTTLPTSGSVSCNPTNGDIGCTILSVCPPGPYPSPVLYCGPSFSITGQYSLQLSKGYTAYFGAVGSTGVTFSGGQTTQSLIFGGIGQAGFVTLLAVAIAGAAIIGLNVFGSGEQNEGIHIIFMGGLLLAAWFILSAAEGFLVGNASSFFVQLNASGSAFNIPNIGSIAYIGITLVYFAGVTSAISRGGAP